MSWDIFVQHFPPDASSLEDIPAGFKPSSIGKRSAVIEQIKGVAPLADFSNPAWGTGRARFVGNDLKRKRRNNGAE